MQTQIERYVGLSIFDRIRISHAKDNLNGSALHVVFLLLLFRINWFEIYGILNHIYNGLIVLVTAFIEFLYICYCWVNI